MIIIKIQGGLGNQLFEYAFGRLLEVKYKKEVKYDLSFYENDGKYTSRKFLLDKFAVKFKSAKKEEVERVHYPYNYFSKFYLFCKKVLNKFFLKKYQVTYDSELLPSIEKMDNLYLEGFWQSYLYVEPILPNLFSEIVLRENNKEIFLDQISRMKSSNSVSVHIRRGDYLSGSKDLEVLDVTYYRDAVKYIEQHIENPDYYIFSDDISWVKENMSSLFKNALYLEAGIFEDYEELILMSNAKHAIIANSSFSWWAAMLNTSKDKIVISPKDWKNLFFKENNDLCPKDWVNI